MRSAESKPFEFLIPHCGFGVIAEPTRSREVALTFNMILILKPEIGTESREYRRLENSYREFSEY